MLQTIPLTEIAVLLAGALLFFVAPKVVGMVLRIIGIALILVGVAMYKFPEQLITGVGPHSTWALLIAALPAIAGVALIAVGEGMAKMAVRIAGLLLILSGLAGLGVGL
ncbi:MAG: hypothetical protein GXO65_02465 [Euryarchaeota archaeon]|nr:hypothetical protein [Euryarchaeota archaeon]